MGRNRIERVLVDPQELVDLITVDLDVDTDEHDAVIDRIAATVDALPEKEREVIELQVWAQLTVQEISDQLGLHRQTVRTRLRRGKARLRDELGDLY